MFLTTAALFSQCYYTNVDLYTCENTLGYFKFLKALGSNTGKWDQGKKQAEIEFSYIFSKKTIYKLVLCDSSNCRITDFRLDFYDDNQKKKVRGSSEINRKFSSQILIHCQVTGIYYLYLRYECDNPLKDCELIMLGSNSQF